MEVEITQEVNLRQKYPEVSFEEADAHAWVFEDKDNFELYACKYPEIKDDEVEVTVLYTGVSRADVQGGREEWGECPRPKCPGQETIGRVTKVGKDVTDRKIGDIIGIGPFINSCQQCEYCLTERDNVCTGLKADERDLDMSCFGGFSTKMQAKARHTFLIPEGLDIGTAAPLLCVGVSAYRALKFNTKKGEKVGILGIGGIGHLAVQFGVALGLEVTAFTSNPAKVEIIKQLGAHHVVVVDEEFKALESLQDSFDVLLNTLTVSDTGRIEQYFGILRFSGRLVQVGVPPIDTNMSFNVITLISKHLRVIGSDVGSIADTKEVLDFCVENKIKIMCEFYEFQDFPKALARVEKETPLFRCVVSAENYTNKNNLK